MKTISHRDLRNRSGEVLREVALGETFLVTNHGRVVAQLVPADTGTELHPTREAVARPVWSSLPRQQVEERTDDALDTLRGDR